MAAPGQRAEQAIQAVVGRLAELWERARSCPRSASTSPPGSASTSTAPRAPSSSRTSTTTWTRLARVWELHFVTVLPVYLAISEWDELYRGLFPDSGPLDSYKLLEGLPNMTVEVGQELWQLSRRALAQRRGAPRARGRPGRRRAGGARGERRGPRVPRRAAGLPGSATGAARTSGRIVAPSWTEDPTPAIESLRDFARRSDADAPGVMTQLAAVGRERAIAEARERLAGYPAAGRRAVRGDAVGRPGRHGPHRGPQLLDRQHDASTTSVRVLLACGARLVPDGARARRRGRLHARPGGAARPRWPSPAPTCAPVVARRAATIERQAALEPPAVLGTLPDAPPPDDAFGRFVAKFFGAPPAEAEAEGELRGAPGSAGRVRGHRADHQLDRGGRAPAAGRHPGRPRRPRRRGRRCSRPWPPS